MKPRHPKYTIKQGDTLQSITRLFGVEQDVWTRYHNNMCRLDHVIRDVLPRHLEDIYLLPELWNRELILNRPAPLAELARPIQRIAVLGYQNTLYLKTAVSAVKYGVNITIQDDKKLNSIKYEVPVKYLGRQDDDFYVEISSPESIRINDLLPDSKADRLAADVYNLLYPIVFRIDRHGCIIGIDNFEEIKKRWDGSLEEIRRNRFGESLEKYLKLCSYSLKNEEKLLRKLKRSYFFSCYFFGIYQAYGEQYTANNEFVFEISPDLGKVLFQTESKIDKYVDRYDMIKVVIKGKSKNNDGAKDLEAEIEDRIISEDLYMDGTYYAKYFIDSKNHIIDAIAARIRINEKEKKEVMIKISNLS